MKMFMLECCKETALAWNEYVTSCRQSMTSGGASVINGGATASSLASSAEERWR
jgi:hypothetical protein